MNDFHKPGKISRALTAYGGYRVKRQQELLSAADGLTPWQPSAMDSKRSFEAERRRPARAPNIESDFITPLFQAIGVTVFGTLIAGYLVWQFEAVWHLACFAGLVAGALWFMGALFLNREMLWIVERISNFDIDQDGYVGQPVARELDPVEIVHKDQRGSIKAMYRLNLEGIEDARLIKFAIGVKSFGLAEAGWIGKGNLFSSGEYGRLLSELERAGLVAWVNPQAHSQGRRLTEQGEIAMEQWADLA